MNQLDQDIEKYRMPAQQLIKQYDADIAKILWHIQEEIITHRTTVYEGLTEPECEAVNEWKMIRWAVIQIMEADELAK